MVAAQAARSLLARLFGRETLLNKLPVLDALAGLTLRELATAAFMKALELERRKLGINADLVIEAKIVVDIRSCDLAGPVWQSPPQNMPSNPGTLPSGSVRMRPHLQATPIASNGAETISWPMAT